MIRTRETRGIMFPQVTTWYFKGARERMERSTESALPQFAPFVATITQCDQKQSVSLNMHLKTYRLFGLPPFNFRRTGQEAKAKPGSPAPDVIVQVKWVDTGDRREVGGYEAHRIKTTIKIRPAKGSPTNPGKVTADAWYLDVPGLNCRAENLPNMNSLMMGLIDLHAHGQPVRAAYQYTGVEPSGLLIEEKATQKSAGNVIQNRTETLEVSDKPLDESLFEVPADFTRQGEARHGPVPAPAAPTVNQ